MQVELELFGALRGLEAGDRVQVNVFGGTVVDARRALQAHAVAQWPQTSQALLDSCAFATAAEILRDGHSLPSDGKLAVLPPVSGG